MLELGGVNGQAVDDGVPIWVLSRHAPGIDVSRWPLVTYATDIETAMSEAKRAAGDRNVLVHGAATAQPRPALNSAFPAGQPTTSPSTSLDGFGSGRRNMRNELSSPMSPAMIGMSSAT